MRQLEVVLVVVTCLVAPAARLRGELAGPGRGGVRKVVAAGGDLRGDPRPRGAVRGKLEGAGKAAADDWDGDLAADRRGVTR